MYPTTFGKFADPQSIVTHFHLREGDVVADFGAGSGHYMDPLAKAVTHAGKVYLCEIQRPLVDTLTIRAHEKGYHQVRPLWSDIEKTRGVNLNDGVLDAALLSNTLFQLEDKRAGLREIARTVRKGGKFFIVEWSDSYGGMGPKSADIVYEENTRKLCEEVGLTFERTFPAGDHHYGLAFRK